MFAGFIYPPMPPGFIYPPMPPGFIYPPMPPGFIYPPMYPLFISPPTSCGCCPRILSTSLPYPYPLFIPIDA